MTFVLPHAHHENIGRKLADGGDSVARIQKIIKSRLWVGSGVVFNLRKPVGCELNFKTVMLVQKQGKAFRVRIEAVR